MLSVLSMNPISDIFFSTSYSGYWYRFARFAPSTDSVRKNIISTTRFPRKYVIIILLFSFSLSNISFFGITVSRNSGVVLSVTYISEHINGFFIPFSSIGKMFSIFICHISPNIVSSSNSRLIISSMNIVLPITVVPLFSIYMIAGRNDSDIIICGVFDRNCDDMKFIRLL